jgi:hypothetical protein
LLALTPGKSLILYYALEYASDWRNTMKRIFLVSALSLLTVACAPAITVPDGCDEHGGPKSVTVKYGAEGITVVPKKNVKRRSVFIIALKPASNDYKDNKVTIHGVSVTPGGAGVADPNWLDTSDAYDTRKKFIYCAPDVPDGTTQDYKYDVVVEGLGRIDPRVTVEW